MSQFKQAAIKLARMGFRVFPLIPWDKKPAIPRFPIAATTDEAQIERWWTDRPDCNIGVSTTGFVVVDVDVKKGAHALQNFELLGGKFDTFTVRTATGGYHCYYKGPDSKLAVDILPGIDIRSHGGFVVGPGSRTSKINPGCVDGDYTVLANLPLAGVPVAVEIVLEAPGVARQRDDNVELDQPYNIANAAVWLQTAEPAIEGRGGNDATYKVCAKIIRDFALTEQTAYQNIVTHWNHRCIPPWAPGELWKLIENAAAYGTADRGAGSPAAQFAGVQIPDAVQFPGALVVKRFDPKGFYPGNAIDPDKQTPRPWKVEKLLMNGDVTILGGMGAAGKSMFQLVSAAHFALGLDFGPYKLKVPGLPMLSIVYNAEDNLEEASRRLLGICLVFGFDYFLVRSKIILMDDRQGDLILAYAVQQVAQRNEDAVQFMIEMARTYAADIIMVDPLVNLHACNENDSAHMRVLINTLRNIARDTNTAIMASHHTNKGGVSREKGDADSFRGSTALVNSARIAVLISRLSKKDQENYGISEKHVRNYARMDVGKANTFQPDGEATAWLKWETVKHPGGDPIGVPTITNLGKNKAEQDSEIALILRDYMRAKATGSMTRTDGARAIQASGHFLAKLSESALRNTIGALLEQPFRIEGDTLTLVTIDGDRLVRLQ